jgi:hypothetical protein
MTQLVVASTLFGAATVAAAADAGLLGEPSGERVLLVVNNAFAPELTPAADEIEGSAPVLARFDRVIHLTDLIAPIHPADWNPGPRERPLLERLLRSHWGLGDGQVDIVAESVWVNPAQTLARIFHTGSITVYADGLMSYGPTRNELPLDIIQRLDGLLHLDLVPGLRPVLLSEYGVTPTVIPSESFRKIIEEIAAKTSPAPEADQPPAAVVVGQYLAALGLVTMHEEAEMHGRMIAAAAKAGAQVVRFKPHPSAPPGFMAPIENAAREAGVTIEVVTDPLPVETMLVASDVVAIVGCFSTALVTARSIFDVPSISVDTTALLKRLRPFENSNRIPVTVIDALHREGSHFESSEALQLLVDTVSYCMQPKSLSDRRENAVTWLRAADPKDRSRYVAGARLAMLGLPGAPKQNPMVRATIDTARTALRHPAMGWVDERTRRSELRKKVVKKMRG